MHYKKAFTLIELLLVVLIIGLLAAIALPQYQKAVEKSKATQALILLKSVQQAYLSYFMANASYATKFSDLDIQMPFTQTTQFLTYQGATARARDRQINRFWKIV